MTKIVCISDTHGLHEAVEIPKCDILIHAGDFCNHGTYQEVEQFAKWISWQPAGRKVVVAGNHDLFCEKHYDLTKLTFSRLRVTYLENQTTVIDGIKIFGSPFSPEFFNWAFMHPRFEMYDKVWSKVPKDVNVLIAHGPMYGVLDKVDKKYANEDSDFHVGCKGLSKRVAELKELRLLVSGHIHCSRGIVKGTPDIINASICNEQYKPTNKPIIYEY